MVRRRGGTDSRRDRVDCQTLGALLQNEDGFYYARFYVLVIVITLLLLIGMYTKG